MRQFSSSVEVNHTDAHLFERLDYRTYVPVATQANGRFVVTRSGLVWPSLRLSRQLSYRGLIPEILGTGVSLASMLKRGSAEMAGDEEVGIIHSSWSGGYYHWLTESLPRAIAIREAFPHAKPILPSHAYKKYADSLTAIGSAFVFFPEEKNLSVEDPIVTNCPERFGTTDPAVLRKTANTVLRYYGLPLDHKPTRVVYASRRKSRGRLVLNEDEVIDSISDLAPVVVCFEDLTFEEQVILLHDTKLFISIHGAGLTNMMFMPIGGAVIELLPKRNGIFDFNIARNSFFHDACYVRLAHALGLTHRCVICDHDVEFWQKSHMSNITVNPGELRRKIEQRD